MRLLLDTHVLLWWLNDSPELSQDAKNAISKQDNMVYISSVCIWEIVIKQSLGKLSMPDNWKETLEAEPFSRLTITWDHAFEVRKLPEIHRDPFDRLLVAQAMIEELVLVTNDEHIRKYNVATLQSC